MIINNQIFSDFSEEIFINYPYQAIVNYLMDDFSISYLLASSAPITYTPSGSMGYLESAATNHISKIAYVNTLSAFNHMFVPELTEEPLKQIIFPDMLELIYANHDIINSSDNTIYFSKFNCYNNIALPELPNDDNYKIIVKMGNEINVITTLSKISATPLEVIIPEGTISSLIDNNWSEENTLSAMTIPTKGISLLWSNYDIIDTNTNKILFSKEASYDYFNGTKLPSIPSCLTEKWNYQTILFETSDLQSFGSLENRIFYLINSNIPLYYQPGDKNTDSSILASAVDDFLIYIFNPREETTWTMIENPIEFKTEFVTKYNYLMDVQWSNYTINYIDSESIYVLNSKNIGDLPSQLKISTQEIMTMANILFANRDFKIPLQGIQEFLAIFKLMMTTPQISLDNSTINYNSGESTSISSVPDSIKQNIIDIKLPAVETIWRATFDNCINCTKCDGTVVNYIGIKAFQNCEKLETIILRKTDTICELGGNNVFDNTPIANGVGYIYVPSTLIETYKTATNWSNLVNQFRTIEDYPEICGTME